MADTPRQTEASTLDAQDVPTVREERRTFLSAATSVAMVGGLGAGYGTFAVVAGRFLFPTGRGAPDWQFVARIEQLAPGESLDYTAPSGAKVVIARREADSVVASAASAAADPADEFIALSSVCPHLGCQVHWEPQNARFFCPCHNGAFDAEGNATEGPPASAGQVLARYPLKVEDGLLYIDAPSVNVADPSRGSTA